MGSVCWAGVWTAERFELGLVVCSEGLGDVHLLQDAGDVKLVAEGVQVTEVAVVKL